MKGEGNRFGLLTEFGFPEELEGADFSGSLVNRIQ